MTSMQDRGCICFPVHNPILSLNYLSLAHLETQLLAELSISLEAHKFTFFNHSFIFISFLLLKKKTKAKHITIWPEFGPQLPYFPLFCSIHLTFQWFPVRFYNCVPRPCLCHCFVEMISMCVAPRIAWKMIVYVSKFSSVSLLWDILVDSSQSVLPLPLSTSMVLLFRDGVLQRFIPITVWLVSRDCCNKLTMRWVAYNIFLWFWR